VDPTGSYMLISKITSNLSTIQQFAVHKKLNLGYFKTSKMAKTEKVH
jgi:hypothetical protein